MRTNIDLSLHPAHDHGPLAPHAMHPTSPNAERRAEAANIARDQATRVITNGRRTCGPFGPGLPGSPWAPSGPGAPFRPFAPGAPGSPWGPIGPGGPGIDCKKTLGKTRQASGSRGLLRHRSRPIAFASIHATCNTPEAITFSSIHAIHPRHLHPHYRSRQRMPSLACMQRHVHDMSKIAYTPCKKRGN